MPLPLKKTFIDTNIFIYAADARDQKKQTTARECIRFLAGEHLGVVSTQVLMEFTSAAVNKLGLSLRSAKRLLHFFNNFEVLRVDADLISTGIDTAILSEISFWDGVILAAAAATRSQILLSEDLSDGQVVNGVEIFNPFARGQLNK